MSRSVQIAAAVTDKNLELVLKVLPAIIVIMAASWACGRLALLVRQPRVLGEMVAGVLLGPTLFGAVWPEAQHFVFPPEVKPILYVLSTIGLTLFMFLVGVGFDHSSSNGAKEAKQAGLLAVSGMVPSLLLGAGAGWLLHDRLSRPDLGVLEFAVVNARRTTHCAKGSSVQVSGLLEVGARRVRGTRGGYGRSHG